LYLPFFVVWGFLDVVSGCWALRLFIYWVYESMNFDFFGFWVLDFLGFE
jgi:hypothetical protein